MRRNDGGMTTIEAITAMVIISIACTLVYSASSTALAAGKKSLVACRAISTISLSDRALRNFAQEVRIPFWERHCEFETSDDSVVIPWYRGIRDQTLRLEAAEHSLSITGTSAEGEKKIIVLRGMDEIAIKPIAPDGEKATGIEVSWKSGGQEYRSILSFGSSFPETDK